MKHSIWQKAKFQHWNRFFLAAIIGVVGCGELLVACGKDQQNSVAVRAGAGGGTGATGTNSTTTPTGAATITAAQNPGSQGANLGNDNLLAQMDSQGQTSTPPPVTSSSSSIGAATSKVTWASQWTAMQISWDSNTKTVRVNGTWTDANGKTQTMPELAGISSSGSANLSSKADTNWSGSWQCRDANFSDNRFCETAIVSLNLIDANQKTTTVRAVVRRTHASIVLSTELAPTSASQNYANLKKALQTKSVADDAAGDVRMALVESVEILHGISLMRLTLIADGNAPDIEVLGWSGPVQAQMINQVTSISGVLQPEVNADTVASLIDLTPKQDFVNLVKSATIAQVTGGTKLKVVLLLPNASGDEQMTLLVTRQFEYNSSVNTTNTATSSGPAIPQNPVCRRQNGTAHVKCNQLPTAASSAP